MMMSVMFARSVDKMDTKEFDEIYKGLHDIPLRDDKRMMWLGIFQLAVNTNNLELINKVKEKIKLGLELKRCLK